MFSPGHGCTIQWVSCSASTVEPLLRGHPDERPHRLERPIDNVNLNINVLISIPDERPPLLKGDFSDAKGVASQEGFHCIQVYKKIRFVLAPAFCTHCNQ